MPNTPNPKFEKAVADFTNILIENELIVEDFLFKEKKCKCIRVYYKRKIFYIIKTCDFTTAEILEDSEKWLNYLECIRQELCCFIREKTECVPVCIKQTLLKSFQSTDGEVTYILRVDVKNESDKKIKNLVVRDLLLKKDMCVALLEVLVDHGCSIKPVDQDTSEQYVGNGYLLDPRKSCLDPHADITLIYTIQLIDQTTTIQNMVSRVEVYGRLVSRTGSEMILEPISRAGDMMPLNEPRDINSRNLINYFIPSNCIAVGPEKFGVNNATVTRVISGISYTIKLTNWVRKSGTTNQYIRVNYELIPTNKGTVSKINAVALNSVYTTNPNNTSGTLITPLNTVIAKFPTRQTTFLLILFCITPCTLPTISLALSPSNPTVSTGTPISVNTVVTGTPTPTVTYSLNNSPFTLTGNTIDTTNLVSGTYTLVATATNICGSTTSNSVNFNICEPPTITLISITPDVLVRNVNEYPYLTVDYSQQGATGITYRICDTSLNPCQTGNLVDASNNNGIQIDVSSLADGTYNFELIATGCGTSTSNTLQFTITTDIIPPVTPVVFSVVDSSNISIINNSSICLPDPPVTYNITVNNIEDGLAVILKDNGTQIGSQIIAGPSGEVTFSNLTINAPGLHAITATVIDASGNSTESAPFNFTIALPVSGSATVLISTSNITDNSFTYDITVTGAPSYDLTYSVKLGNNIVSSGLIDNSGSGTGIISNASFEQYTVEIIASNGVCPPAVIGSQNFTVCLLPNVSISPSSQSIVEGGGAIFTATASNIQNGDIPSYQWYKDNIAINGETSNILILSNLSLADDDSQYYVIVTNGCNASRTSTQVTLNVNAAPLLGISVLDSQLTPIINGSTVCSSPTYTINITSALPGSTVRLYDNDIQIESEVIADQSGMASFNNVVLNPDEIHNLSATSTNLNSTVPSIRFTFTAVSTLSGTVSVILAISEETINSFKYLIAIPDNSVSPTPDSWSYKIINKVTNNDVVIVDESITSISDIIEGTITGASSGQYEAQIYATNVCGTYLAGSVTSTACLLPSIVTQPLSQTITEGSPVTFTVSATVTNNDSITYQWYSSTTGLISGAEADSFTLANASSADNGSEYYVIVTSGCGKPTRSSSAKLTVQSAVAPPNQPQILFLFDAFTNSIPNNSSICSTLSPYNVLVSADGGSTVYIYLNNNLVGSSFTFNGGLVSVPNITINGYGQQTLVAQVIGPNNNASPMSVPFTFDIGAEPNGFIDVTTRMTNSISKITPEQRNNFNYYINLSNNNIDSSPYSLTYTINNTYTNEVIISGSINPNYNIVAGTILNANTNSYDTLVFATNSCGTRRVGITTTTICLSPTITANPEPQTVLVGATATFNVSASIPTPATLSYQWYRNSVPIVGATTSTLSIPNVSLADNQTSYFVRVSSDCGRAIDSKVVFMFVTEVTNPPRRPVVYNVVDAAFTPITTVFKLEQTFSLSYNVYVQSDIGSTVRLYMNNNIVGTSITPIQGAIIFPITVTTPGQYVLTADATNNAGTSLLSNPYTFTIIQKLTIPELLSVINTPNSSPQGFNGDDNLTWTQSVSNIGNVIVGYNIYRGLISQATGEFVGSLLTSVPAPSLTKSLPADPQSTRYSVTAVDNMGNESGKSNVLRSVRL